jgi:tetratricopeptide (TPR) repeat protein
MRRYLVFAAAALAAAGLTVGITLATRTTPPKPHQARPGFPPLVLELGVRTDPEAVALRRATDLYNRGNRRDAAPIFARYRSLEARLGAAFAAWPGGFDAVRTLAAENSRSALAGLNYGIALVWKGDEPEARQAWRLARRVQPDTPYAVRAEDLLFPNFPRGLPTFVPSFRAPAALDRLSPPQQLAFLAGHARAGGVRAKLLYGVALQRLGQQLSALREYEAAAALAPRDPEPKVAAAVARFDKGNPSRSFSRLGPLSRTYSKSQSVRFHLGLLLLWLGQVDQAKKELRLARSAAPKAPLGREAQKFLQRLAGIGT